MTESSTDSSEIELMHSLRDSPAIFESIADAAGLDEFRLQKQLRKDFSPEIVRAAIGLVELRKHARTKFSRADQMWFDRRGLEQSTSEAVAEHKAKRFDRETWDLCSGIGGDAMALAAKVSVHCIDVNPASCLRAEWNANVYDVGSNVATHCQTAESVDIAGKFVHIDPDRRATASGARSLRLADSVPSLEYLQELTESATGGAIKLSPASDFLGKFPATEIELISLNGECKEATVWFGELAGDAPFRATALPSNETLAGDPMSAFVPIDAIADFIHDPDPAIVRAGLVDLVAETLELSRLDSAEEYLTSNAVSASAFVRSFRVLEVLPNNDKEIRRAIQARDIGQIEIKCRHIPISAESIRRKLKLKGSRAAALIYARLKGKAHAILCERIVE